MVDGAGCSFYIHFGLRQNKMDEYLAEAQRQINNDATYLPPPTQMQPPLPTIAPTMPHLEIQSGGAPAAPAVTTTTTPNSFTYNLGLYMSLGFVFLLLTYVAVTYARDVRNRDVRNKRHNLTAYVEYSMALANRLPHGHQKVVTVHAEDEVEEDEESMYVSDVSSIATSDDVESPRK